MSSDDNLDNDDQKAVLVKVSNMSSLKALSLIKQRLIEQQYEVFKETCFGHFVYLQDLKFAGQIVHALLLRYVRSTDKAMYFKIGQKECRFSMLEFALITGLKCHKEHDLLVHEKDNTDSICDVFMGGNHEFTQKQLQKAFSTAQSNDDTLMVKFAMLYFLESVLLGKEPKNKIDDLHIRLLDNFKEFNNYPWGRLSFEATMLSLKNTVTRRSKRIGSLDPNTEEKYSLYGFPFAFQVWTYEVISEFGQKFTTEKGDLKVPRILKWFCKNKIMADVINKALKEENTVTPSYRVSIGDHVAPTFQKIYDRLSKIEEKVQKIDVLEAKLDNITKDLWRTTKLLEKFLASFNAAKDSPTDEWLRKN
ncbi:uncharacterized protein LOC112498961 [Citrus sinensis]|uniref:uncharacterized protein LOC112498961 n=1 Tax=Citrus sinensis TaxID=2711 RepID=UPI00227801FC|nr:uncharacterized protein LOC112498961 [Citrus sinensis]